MAIEIVLGGIKEFEEQEPKTLKEVFDKTSIKEEDGKICLILSSSLENYKEAKKIFFGKNDQTKEDLQEVGKKFLLNHGEKIYIPRKKKYISPDGTIGPFDYFYNEVMKGNLHGFLVSF